jgi:hypothetical protein
MTGTGSGIRNRFELQNLGAAELSRNNRLHARVRIMIP